MTEWIDMSKAIQDLERGIGVNDIDECCVSWIETIARVSRVEEESGWI